MSQRKEEIQKIQNILNHEDISHLVDEMNTAVLANGGKAFRTGTGKQRNFRDEDKEVYRSRLAEMHDVYQSHPDNSPMREELNKCIRGFANYLVNGEMDYLDPIDNIRYYLNEFLLKNPNSSIKPLIEIFATQFRSTSQWLYETKVNRNELFLEEETHKDLYSTARQRMKSGQHADAHEPVEQLSAKGLAIMSHLYAEKDKSRMQPLIASSIDDLKHIATLLDKAEVGTKVTIIFNPGGRDDSLKVSYPPNHKTALQIERTANGLRVTNMDSTNILKHRDATKKVILQALEANAKANGTQQTHLTFLTQEGVQRQYDEYQCAIFATKDARQMNRDSGLSQRLQSSAVQHTSDENSTDASYPLPPEYQKGIQSRTAAAQVAAEHGNAVVTRKGQTLDQVQAKHNMIGYVQHFAEKYHTEVESYYQKNNDNPNKIKADTAEFDAGQMTSARLAAVYGPAAKAELSKAGGHSVSTNADIHRALLITSSTPKVSNTESTRNNATPIEQTPAAQAIQVSNVSDQSKMSHDSDPSPGTTAHNPVRPGK